jgi:hypothetical protein
MGRAREAGDGSEVRQRKRQTMTLDEIIKHEAELHDRLYDRQAEQSRLGISTHRDYAAKSYQPMGVAWVPD